MPATDPTVQVEKSRATEGDGQDEVAQVENIVEAVREGQTISPAMREKISEHYAELTQDTNAAPEGDVNAILERILAMTEEEAVDVLVGAIAFHKVGQLSFTLDSVSLFP